MSGASMIATNGLVDFHCHLDLYPDHQAAVRGSEEAGVFTLAVTTTPRAWSRNQELTQGMRHVRAALGLHPQLVAERASELPLWEAHLGEARYVGEVGLDADPVSSSRSSCKSKSSSTCCGVAPRRVTRS